MADDFVIDMVLGELEALIGFKRESFLYEIDLLIDKLGIVDVYIDLDKYAVLEEDIKKANRKLEFNYTEIIDSVFFSKPERFYFEKDFLIKELLTRELEKKDLLDTSKNSLYMILNKNKKDSKYINYIKLNNLCFQIISFNLPFSLSWKNRLRPVNSKEALDLSKKLTHEIISPSYFVDFCDYQPELLAKRRMIPKFLAQDVIINSLN